MKLQIFTCLVYFAGKINAAFQLQQAAPIEVRGTKFFNSSSGGQFFVRGVAYQRSRKNGDNFDIRKETAYIDSLAQPHKCLKDLEYLTELGVNTIRAYQINPKLNHDVCMNALADKGIYVLADLSEPQVSINRETPSWDTDLKHRYQAVVDSLHNYTNVLGFIAGNEVLNTVNTSNTAAFVKASVRDIKAYIKESGYRKIPVGYASVDEAVTRADSADYFTCGDSDSAVDFYGLNNFEWCGYSTYETSGYEQRTAEFGKLPVPVMFTEFGCNRMKPRAFTEVDALFGPLMTPVWSGGVVYEFFQNENNYGLVMENSAGHLVKMEDFNIVKLRLLESVPRGTHKDLASKSPRPTPNCPSVSSTWKSSAELPPTPNEGVCQCLQASLSCIVSPRAAVDLYKLLAELCTKTDCSELSGDGTKGIYGSLSGCGMRQKASYLLNKLWLDSGKDAKACHHDGRAALVNPNELMDLRSVRTRDGQTCEEALKKAVPGSNLVSASFAQNTAGERSFRQNNSAPMVTHWGYMLLPVFVISFMYLTT